MSYVDENLMPGEQVTYRARLHWVIFSAPTILALLGLLFSVPFLLIPDSRPLAALGGIIFLAAGLLALSRWVDVKTSEFAITNKRVIIKVGLIRRHTLELLLTKVEGIGVDQSVVGRMLGYGTIVVTGTGGTKEPFKNISQPLEFRKHVQVQSTA